MINSMSKVSKYVQFLKLQPGWHNLKLYLSPKPDSSKLNVTQITSDRI